MPEEMNIRNLFSYHKPKNDQAARYEILRDVGRKLAVTIMECCPESEDRKCAIRKVREAVMTANASIACNK